MAKQTKQQANIKRFEARGYRVADSRSTKYVRMTNGDREHDLWLGKAGAVRVGPNIAESFSISG